NAYSYLTFMSHRSLTTTLGLSWDRFNDGDPISSRTQLTHKCGVLWSPWNGVIWRAAAFRTLKRAVISSQTIEPTEVAGFNQFFDDGNGTDAWLFGVGFDQKLAAHWYAGVEFTRRNLTSPVPMGPVTVAYKTQQDAFRS